MSDGYSFTQEQIDVAAAAGFSDPQAYQRKLDNDRIAADAAARGDSCEARILSGAVAATDVPEAERRERSMVETMFSGSGLTPWHRLPEAKVIQGQLRSAEAIVAAGLDWRVRMEEVQVVAEEWRGGDKVPSRAIVRESDKKVLGAGGLRYTPLQNESLFAVGDALAEGGARWETAGSLEGGKRVWALMRFEEKDEGDEIAKGDKVVTYLCLANSHDGSRAAEVFLTTIRPVCNNSFRLAAGAAQADGLFFRFRHTSTVEERMAAAGEVLATARKNRDAFVKAARAMTRTRYTEEAQIVYLQNALGIRYGADGAIATPQMKTKLEHAKAALAAERTLAAALGNEVDSVWTAFNAVTRFTTHDERAVRGDAAKRLASANFGDLAVVNRKAWDDAVTVVEVQQETIGAAALAAALGS